MGTIQDRWAFDEQLAEEQERRGQHLGTITEEPRWVADDLADAYGPDAPTQTPNPMNDPKDSGR